MGASLYPLPPSAYAPVVVSQTGAPVNFSGTDWNPFMSSEWQSAFFVVPPSGKVFITISASLRNTVTTGSTIWVGWSMRNFDTGATIESRSEANAINFWTSARLSTSRRVYREGLPPGANIAIDPYWNVTSAGDGTVTYVKNGQLMIEPIP